MMNKQVPRKVLIVGGGTAGWITALTMAKVWEDSKPEITLIDSEQIGIIGVGEGSTVAMKDYFERMKIPESEWMPQCQATYKAGIFFPGWTDQHSLYPEYFHPFFSKVDKKTGRAFIENTDLRRQGYQVPLDSRNFFLAAALSKHQKAPVKLRDYIPGSTEYAYHFDSAMLGQFLRKKALCYGVTNLKGNVQHVNLHPNGSIHTLISKEHGELSADLFVDCTGFQSLMLEKALKVPFISYGNTLLNDSAVAIQTYDEDLENLPPYTESKGLSAGWRWRIPLANRYGNGYVYSSNHITAEQAERELRASLGKKADTMMAKHIKMRVGRTARHYEQNCLAVGLSQGFIEPLEASALSLVLVTVLKFVNDSESGQFEPQEFNNTINSFFDGTLDYIGAHYKVNSRTDTQYWIDAREGITISPFLAQLLEKWHAGDNVSRHILAGWDYPPYVTESWYALLAGKGYFPDATKPIEPQYYYDGNKSFAYLESIAAQFPSHGELVSFYHGNTSNLEAKAR